MQCRRTGFDPWVMKFIWRKEWQSIPVFLPGECPGQRSLAGYSPWGRIALDTTEGLTLSLSNHFLAPGTGLMEDNFSTDCGAWFQDSSSILRLLCALFLLLLHQLHLRSSGIKSWRLGTPVLWHLQILKDPEYHSPTLSWCPSACSFLAPATFPGQNLVHHTYIPLSALG